MDMRPGPRLGDDLEMRVGQVEWPRAFGVIRDQWADVDARMRELSSVPARETTEWTEEQRVLSGVWSAAVWTIGDQPRAPVSHKDLPLTWTNVRDETSLAYACRNMPGRGWDVLYMAGAHSWLQWIAGEAGRLVSPVEAATL